jgi:CheY-like chemotaxis protein
MSVLWLIEDSPRQLKDLQSLLTKMGHTVHAFSDTDEVLEHISSLPTPEAIVVDLALKGTSNGFQTAEEIRKLRPEIAAERFCFISGWKKQFTPLAPAEFQSNKIIDKGNWTLNDLQTALDRAIKSQKGV